MFYKKAVLQNLTILTTRKHLWWSLVLVKLQTLRPVALLKRDFKRDSYEYCKIFKKIYFEDHLQTAASAFWSFLYKEFVDISYENASFGILEDTIWLQLIYAFWPMEYLFSRIICVANTLCSIYRSNQPLWKIHGIA